MFVFVSSEKGISLGERTRVAKSDDLTTDGFTAKPFLAGCCGFTMVVIGSLHEASQDSADAAKD
jgi:hypothetical protein